MTRPEAVTGRRPGAGARTRRELRFLLLWGFWGPVSAIAQRLPVRWVLHSVAAMARLAYPLLGARRRRIEDILRAMLPDMSDAELRSTARRTVRNWALSETENMLQQSLIDSGSYDRLEIRELDTLKAALARQKGAILLIAHFGAHLQVLPALALQGLAVNQLTNRRSVDEDPTQAAPRPGFFERRYFQAQERRHGKVLPVNMIIAGRYMRPVYECLKRNEVLVMAVDGRQHGSLDSFPFLGYRSCPFSNGAASLADRTGAAIVPAFVVRDTTGENRIVIENEIVIDRKGEAGAGIREGTARFVGLLEDYVRRFPDHCGMEFFSDGMVTAEH